MLSEYGDLFFFFDRTANSEHFYIFHTYQKMKSIIVEEKNYVKNPSDFNRYFHLWI